MIGSPFVAGFLVVALPAAGEALSDAELLTRAEAAFRDGVAARSNPGQARASFARAAAAYDALRRRGFQSAVLYRNQGNAHLLAGDLPQAILAYRRGLRLAPGDRALQSHLAQARGQVVHPAVGSFQRWPWFPRLAPGLLGTAGWTLYALGWLGLTRWLMVRRSWLLYLAAGAWVAAAVMGAGLILEEGDRRRETRHPLVVIARDGVKLRKGNGHLYPLRDDTPLNRGVEAQWLFTRARWLQIQLADGKVGWVPRGDVLVDAPSLPD